MNGSLSRAYLLLGTNLGDRINNLQRAEFLISSFAGIMCSKSSVFESEAWGNINQPDFLNQLLVIGTMHSPADLLEITNTIEKQVGRLKESEKWQPRLLDIDILFYDNMIINTPELMIPHSQIAFRRFALVPLAEVAPELIHPDNKKTISEMLNECNDELEVRPLIKHHQNG